MKKYFYFAAAAMMLASCANDEYIGDDIASTTGDVAISFDGGTGAITRAAKTGSDAATALNNNFVVYGYKTTSAGVQTVYDHYTVNWGGAPGSTASNSAGWEYVGQELNMLTNLNKTGGAVQDIKYWDLAATQYDFVAFSTGTATQVAADKTPIVSNEVAISKVTPANAPAGQAANTGTVYTIKGAADDLAKVYIADRVSAKASGTEKANLFYTYKNAIQFNFRSLGSKVRLGIYETIPGYSVANVKFYKAGETTANAATKPTLFAESASVPGGEGTMTITFGPNDDASKTDYNKAHASFAPTGSTNTKDLTFGDINLKGAEKLESTSIATQFLGRTSPVGSDKMNVSICDYVTVLPAEVGSLTLKVDYTLVPLDGSNGTIDVVGATATVPAQYCTWQPNYAYTYIFKITDKTSGTIGGNPAGLWPITFDAIVTETEDGVQETITEVEVSSITTYQKGKVVTANDEYTAGRIYVAVAGTPTMTEGTNYNLYTATIAADALQGITEESVENCLKNAKTYTAVADKATMTAGTTYYTSATGAGKIEATAENLAALKADANTYYTAAAVGAAGPWTVTDAAGKALTLTLANDVIAPATAIPADDSPTGNAFDINCAVINATAGTTYVFEYISGGVKSYKVIKVVAAP